MTANEVYTILNNKIKKISGGGSSTPITVTSNITVGAIPAGSKIVSKTSDELWKWALVRALAPQITFTSTESETIVREKGTLVNTTLDVKIVVTIRNDIFMDELDKFFTLYFIFYSIPNLVPTIISISACF